jgi:acetyltransferase-like isoleucine patch superfamily enzyme
MAVSFRRLVACSEHPAARLARRAYWAFRHVSLPAPRAVVRPMLWFYLSMRSAYYFIYRVFVCEPLFKAYCKSYGRGLRTGVYIHWVEGSGEIILGNDVLVDGKCSFTFAARFCDRPVLEVGDHSHISHDCSFTVGRRITIGRHTMIAMGVWMFDASGHPTAPAGRLAGLPPSPDKVRPITIGDNAWIGMKCLILPGTTIGEGSVVCAGSVVRGEVPPYTIVAGNPARVVATLPKPADQADARKLGANSGEAAVIVASQPPSPV